MADAYARASLIVYHDTPDGMEPVAATDGVRVDGWDSWIGPHARDVPEVSDTPVATVARIADGRGRAAILIRQSIPTELDGDLAEGVHATLALVGPAELLTPEVALGVCVNPFETGGRFGPLGQALTSVAPGAPLDAVDEGSLSKLDALGRAKPSVYDESITLDALAAALGDDRPQLVIVSDNLGTEPRNGISLSVLHALHHTVGALGVGKGYGTFSTGGTLVADPGVAPRLSFVSPRVAGRPPHGDGHRVLRTTNPDLAQSYTWSHDLAEGLYTSWRDLDPDDLAARMAFAREKAGQGVDLRTAVHSALVGEDGAPGPRFETTLRIPLRREGPLEPAPGTVGFSLGMAPVLDGGYLSNEDPDLQDTVDLGQPGVSGGFASGLSGPSTTAPTGFATAAATAVAGGAVLAAARPWGGPLPPPLPPSAGMGGPPPGGLPPPPYPGEDGPLPPDGGGPASARPSRSAPNVSTTVAVVGAVAAVGAGSVALYRWHRRRQARRREAAAAENAAARATTSSTTPPVASGLAAPTRPARPYFAYPAYGYQPWAYPQRRPLTPSRPPAGAAPRGTG